MAMLNASRLLALDALRLALAALTGGCSSLERLRLIGEPPALASIENPQTQPGYKPVQMPMPAPQPAVYNPNSLWRNGSRAFFKDQRAHQIGDILTVTVNITDKATIENETQSSRDQQGGFRRHRLHRQQDLGASAAKAILPGRHLHRRFHRLERRQGLGRPQGGVADQRRRQW